MSNLRDPMVEWKGKYISPYAEYGKKANKLKKLRYLFL